MANTTTYSFQDVICTINLPGSPPISVNGLGIGEITLAPINDNTAHDLAADGSIMVTKVQADNGNITISAQQTSALNTFLINAFKFLKLAPTNLWAQGTITIASPSGLGQRVQCTGVSFTKRSDKNYQQQGQKWSWQLMAASIQDL